MVAARGRLADGRRARCHHARDQQARLDLGARDRQLVLDPGQLGPADRERRQPAVAHLDVRAHRAERLGDPVDRAAPDRFVAVERPVRPGCPASQPGRIRMSVPALPTPMSPPVASSGAEPDPAEEQASSPSSSMPAPSGRHRASTSCQPSRGSCARRPARRTSPRRAPRGARSTCPQAGCSRSAARRQGRSGRLRSLGADREPSASISSRARAAWSSPAIQSVMAPERMSTGASARSTMLTPGPAELECHLGDDTGAVRHGQAKLVDRLALGAGSSSSRRSSRARSFQPATSPPSSRSTSSRLVRKARISSAMA